jgi:hypothetical protein
MNKWKGKSKGTILGYRIFVWCIRNIGIRVHMLFYTLLLPIIFVSEKKQPIYFLLFSEKTELWFLENKAFIFKSYFTFGKVLIDKTAISAGLRNKYTYEFDGIENQKSFSRKKEEF